MAVSQHDDEVQSVLFGYVLIRQHVGGKWIVELNPAMLNPFVEQKLPPGQVVSVGADGYVSEYSGELNRVHGADGWHTLHDLALWAAVPHFHSFESAQAKIMQWLNDERPDLVAACQSFVSEARAYRARQADRPAPPRAPAPAGGVWDQLMR